MAGFMFQLLRALNRLAESVDGSVVGIETLDDVISTDPDGTITFEQDKLSFCRNPISDQSPNLWNTLATWVSVIDEGEYELHQCRFCLVSAFPISSGIAAMLKAPTEDRDNAEIAKRLQQVAARAGQSINRHAATVRLKPIEHLTEIVRRITVIDSSCDDSKEQLAERLQLTPEVKDDVIGGLTGWLYWEALDRFVCNAQTSGENRVDWISTRSFRLELQKQIARHHDGELVVRAFSEIIAEQRDINENLSARFVRQLKLLSFGDDERERLIESVIDYLKADEETTRLAGRNEVTKRRFDDFERHLRDHWRDCFRRGEREPLQTEERTGQRTLDESLGLMAYLDGKIVAHRYLTKGTFHALANRTGGNGVGWHPRYAEILSEANT